MKRAVIDDTDIEKAWKTQKWKSLKISPLSFWEKHKKRRSEAVLA